MLHSRLVLLIIVIATFDEQLCERCSQRMSLKRDLVHFGSQTGRGEWPWHAALFHQINQSFPSYACGGTVVSRTFIITAAHCTYPPSRVRELQAREILVRVGISNIRELEDTFQEMRVTKIFRHKDYKPETSYNDVALLQLVAELKFTDYVNPICLWRGNVEEDEIVGKEGYVPGWGKDEKDLFPDILKLAVMPIVSRQACEESDPDYYTRYLCDRKTFCAGFRNGTSVGPGDSGSGLYIQINEEWLLRGIVSNGKLNPNRTLDTESYFLFTDVAYYIKWIRTKINSLDAGGLDPIHVEECSVCGEKIEMPYSRPGSQDTRTWPWKADIYFKGIHMYSAVIISEYFLLSHGILPCDKLCQFLFPGFQRSFQRSFSIKQHEDIRAVFESDQRVEIATRYIDRIFLNISTNGTTNIILWKMRTSLNCTIFLRPICLFGDDPLEEKSKQLTTYTPDASVILDNNVCTEHFLMEMQMMGNYSFCYQFDSIAPLDFTYITRDKRWYLYGTPSESRTYDEAARKLNVYSLHIRRYVFAHYMSHYKDWIDTQILNVWMNLLGLENCVSIEQFVYKIYSNGKFRCFATQITPGILITTALCVDNELSNIYCKFVNGSKVRLHSVLMHPSYNRTNIANNIAIVKYCPTTPNASICLPKFPGKIANMSLPAGLSKIISRNYSQNITLTDTELCAQIWKRAGVKVVTDGSYICGRMPVVDSASHKNCAANLHGMPLLYSTPDAAGAFLRGILDIGKKDYCKDDGLPDIYINVTYYADWIAEQVMSISKWCEDEKVADAASETSTQRSTAWWKFWS